MSNEVSEAGASWRLSGPRASSETIREGDVTIVSIPLDVGLLEPLFPGVSSDTLVIACAPSLRPLIELPSRDRPTVELAWTGRSSREELIDMLAGGRESDRISVLWLADSEFKHFHPDELRGARIAAWSFFSSTPTQELVAEAIRVTRCSDYGVQERIEAGFLALLDEADHILIRDRRFGYEARVAHQQCDHWFSLNGPIGYGGQSVLPTGELSVLADSSGEYSSVLLPIDGEILLYGETLVHRGDSSIDRARTWDTYQRMAAIGRDPVVARVQNGAIVGLSPGPESDGVGVEVLGQLFAEDDRYRKIHELGFGTNPACRPLHGGNFFGDERHPGVHFGLGLGGHLSFHFDIVCPDTTVIACTNNGDHDILVEVGLS